MKFDRGHFIELVLKLDDYYSHKDLRNLYNFYKASMKMDDSEFVVDCQGLTMWKTDDTIELCEEFERSEGAEVVYHLEDKDIEIRGESRLAEAVRDIVCSYLIEDIDVELYTLEDKELYRLEHHDDLGGFMKKEVTTNGESGECKEFLTYKEVWELVAGTENKKYDDKIVIPRELDEEEEETKEAV